MTTETKQKYTAGPWQAKGHAILAGKNCVGRVYEVDTEAELQANLALIVAAPSLLDAAKAATDLIAALQERPRDKCGIEWRIAAELLQAAIALAEKGQG